MGIQLDWIWPNVSSTGCKVLSCLLVLLIKTLHKAETRILIETRTGAFWVTEVRRFAILVHCSCENAHHARTLMRLSFKDLQACFFLLHQVILNQNLILYTVWRMTGFEKCFKNLCVRFRNRQASALIAIYFKASFHSNPGSWRMSSTSAWLLRILSEVVFIEMYMWWGIFFSGKILCFMQHLL